MSQWPSRLSPVLVLAAAVGVLAPAWIELDRFDAGDDRDITSQRAADATQGVELNRLIATIKRRGGGRTYAGTPSNWGNAFSVGQVPVFKYLESRDVDEVGYTLRTASLMTNPEYYFDQNNPSDYRLYAIRYLIYPSGKRPQVPAEFVSSDGRYALWTIAANGYIQTGRIVGELAANRADVGAASIPLQKSTLTAHGDYLKVNWGSRALAGRLPRVTHQASVGAIASQHATLTDGRASAIVTMAKPGVAVLSASFDPGWQATVNGHHVTTEMISPALTGVNVPAGTDHVVFSYHGYGEYPELFILAALTLIVVGTAPAYRNH